MTGIAAGKPIKEKRNFKYRLIVRIGSLRLDQYIIIGAKMLRLHRDSQKTW